MNRNIKNRKFETDTNANGQNGTVNTVTANLSEQRTYAKPSEDISLRPNQCADDDNKLSASVGGPSSPLSAKVISGIFYRDSRGGTRYGTA
ncbi:hypothetical protein ROHU_033597 [Labeo rohita]|uniref:Uncharacterized protein n=1 Tax=Labeo rohita TaxID=84645 RepID=A0A498LAA4_LABRO|nr:hypothetical protein ROHU_033597 [Labeo rohita]